MNEIELAIRPVAASFPYLRATWLTAGKRRRAASAA